MSRSSPRPGKRAASKKLTSPERFLCLLVSRGSGSLRDGVVSIAGEALRLSRDDAEGLVRRDLAMWDDAGVFSATSAGRAWVARCNAPGDPHRSQHGEVAAAEDLAPGARIELAESPLLWLHRRKDSAGNRLIGDAMFTAGERLRSDFTYGNLAPRVSSNWDASGSSSGLRAPAEASDSALAARQRVRGALDAVGPELSGVLLDVCCFLKRLEEVERDRRWPPRSAKVILGLALTKLARHYGYSDYAEGKPRRRDDPRPLAFRPPPAPEQPRT